MANGTELLWTIPDREGIEGRTLDPERIATLDALLKATYGPQISVPSFERLRSKKNIVLQLLLDNGSVECDVVAKLFIEPSFEVEKEVLTLGMKVALDVPSIITSLDGVILMVYIDGVPLVDILNETLNPAIMDHLAAWYYTFHHKTGHVKGDPRLRNFILREDRIFGLDFEGYRRDHWMQDIAGISASILDTRPVFDDRKVHLVWHLLESYLSLSGQKRSKGTDTHFTEVIADTLEQTAAWRDDEEILVHARRVREEGLPSS